MRGQHLKTRIAGPLRLVLEKRGGIYWLRVSHAAITLRLGVRSLGRDELSANHSFEVIGDRIEAWEKLAHG